MKRLPPRDPGTPDQEQGLYRKWNVVRLGDPKGRHRRCQVFVLDLHHDPFAGPALEAYAKACEAQYPKLAADVRERAAEISKRAAAEARARGIVEAATAAPATGMIVYVPPPGARPYRLREGELRRRHSRSSYVRCEMCAPLRCSEAP